MTVDFNLYVDIKPDVEDRRICSTMDSHGMAQYVNGTSRKQRHILDLVCRESRSIIVEAPSECGPCLSNNKGKSFGDHLAVQIIINMDNSNCIRRKITYRKYRCLNIKEFIVDPHSSQHMSKCEGSLDEVVETYNKGVKSIINHHDPSVSQTITLRPETSWYADKLRSSTKMWSKAERNWCRTSLMVHFEIYKNLYKKWTHYYSRRSLEIPQRKSNVERLYLST